jgi:hypothetical protein
VGRHAGVAEPLRGVASRVDRDDWRWGRSCWSPTPCCRRDIGNPQAAARRALKLDAIAEQHEQQPEWSDAAYIRLHGGHMLYDDNPVIVAGRCARTPEGLRMLVEIAETLQAPVNDRPFRFRMNFPTRHPLYGGGNIAEADVVLGLEVSDFWNATHAQTPVNRTGMEVRATTKPGAKLVTISSSDLLSKSNYQDFGAYAEVDLAISGDAEASLPALIEACKRLITSERKQAFSARGAKLAEAAKRAAQETLDQAAWGWDASPITTARLSAEIWNAIKHDDWSLVSDVVFLSYWPTRLWDFGKHYQYIGGQGAYGIGYGAPAAVGAALANKKHGRLTVNIQCDGDLNYAPGVLWTAAHHRIPLLTIMHNNRAYHQERMYVQDMAARAERGIDRADIGTAITDPNINYAMMAKAYGVYSDGPIENPATWARPFVARSTSSSAASRARRRADAAPLKRNSLRCSRKTASGDGDEEVLRVRRGCVRHCRPCRGRRASARRRQRGKRQAPVREGRMLRVPRLRRAGRKRRRPPRRHRDERAVVHSVYPPSVRRHAGVHDEGRVRPGTGGHLCLRQRTPGGETVEGHSAVEQRAREVVKACLAEAPKARRRAPPFRT